jgi:hypothetical protein
VYGNLLAGKHTGFNDVLRKARLVMLGHYLVAIVLASTSPATDAAAIRSSTDLAEAMSEGLNCLHALVNDPTADQADPSHLRQLKAALDVLKAGTVAGPADVDDALLKRLDDLIALADAGDRFALRILAKAYLEDLSAALRSTITE